jgi:Mg/Co/Ni transporter MgtE
MRTAGVTVLAIVGGLLAGLVLSEIIGIVGMLVFGAAAGFRFLPVYLAIACGIAAPLLYRRSRRDPARNDPAEGFPASVRVRSLSCH